MVESAPTQVRVPRRSPHWQRRAPGALMNVFLAVLLLWIFFPAYWMIISALKRADDLFTRVPDFVPPVPTLENFQWALQQSQFLLTFRNSLIVSTGTALLGVTVATLAAYSMVRFRYPGRGLFARTLVATQMLPGVLMIIPLFVIFARLHLVNSYLGLILGYTTFSVPFSILMLRGYFAQFPIELEEAGLIDGCSRLTALWHITIPLTIPGIVAILLFTFVHAWDDFLFALVLTKDASAMTVTVQLDLLVSEVMGSTNWGGIIAEATLITLPVVLLFIFLQKWLVEGMTAGAIKA